MLGTAWPTSVAPLRLAASNQASATWPGCTRSDGALGAKVQSSAEFTEPSNCTVTQRDSSTPSAPTAAPDAASFDTSVPNTFSHAMRYAGTSAKQNRNAPRQATSDRRSRRREPETSASEPLTRTTGSAG